MALIPKGVRDQAMIGNLMIKNGYNGGTTTGWNRGRQLATAKTIPYRDLRVMRAWFARHRHTSRPGYLRWVKDGKPTKLVPGMKDKYRGAVAWLIWGGDAAYDWVRSPQIAGVLRKEYDVDALPSL